MIGRTKMTVIAFATTAAPRRTFTYRQADGPIEWNRNRLTHSAAGRYAYLSPEHG